MKDWFINILRSRKFWFGFVLPVVAAAAGLAVGELKYDQFVNTTLAAGLGVVGGIAVEDGLAKRSFVTRIVEETSNNLLQSGQHNQQVGTQSTVTPTIGGNAGDVQTAGRDAYWKGEKG